MYRWERGIYNEVDKLNERVKNLADEFGKDSELYLDAMNKINASGLQVYTNKNGVVQVSKGKASIQSLKGQKQKVSNINRSTPTARQAKQKLRQEIAEKKHPEARTQKQMQKARASVSDADIKRYLDAKKKVKDYTDEKGKIRYDESIREELSKKGTKTYEELAELIARMKEGDTLANIQTAEITERVEASYESGKVKI